jgi:hypothetical protein
MIDITKGAAMRNSIGFTPFIKRKQTGDNSYTLTRRFRVHLDCGHTVIRDTPVGRAKCARCDAESKGAGR